MANESNLHRLNRFRAIRDPGTSHRLDPQPAAT
jgi:hypothetical protein